MKVKIYLSMAFMTFMSLAGCDDSENIPDKPDIQEDPRLTLPEIADIPSTGGDFTLEYTLEHPLSNTTTKVTAECSSKWLRITSIEQQKINFSVEEYVYKEGMEDRTAEIQVSYASQKQTATIKQLRPDKPVPQEMSFQIELQEITPSTVSVRCTPSDTEATYILQEMRKAHFDEFGNDRAVIDADIKRFQEEDWSGNVGKISDHLVQGVQEDLFHISDTEPYYIMAYGLNEDGTVTTSTITKVEVTGLPCPVITADWDNNRILPLAGGTFEVNFTIENPLPQEKVSVNPPYNTPWLHDITIGDGVISFVVDENNTSEPGASPRESYFTIEYPYARERATVLIKQESPAAELSFQIEIVSMRPSEINARSTPSDPQATYVFREISRAQYEQFQSDEELIRKDIENFQQEDWYGNIGQISDHLVTGVQQTTFYTSSYDKEYYIIAYGLNADGTITTSKLTKVLCTLPEKPSINITWDNNRLLPIEGGTYTIPYTITNPLDGCRLSVEKQWGVEWIEIVEVSETEVTFKVLENTEANEDGSPRTSFLTLSYPDAISSTVPLIKQSSPIKVQ